jgi:hypothetical protein
MNVTHFLAPLSSPDLIGRPSIPETTAMESRGRGVLDHPLEPVIGLAEGETRWRMMTAVRWPVVFAPRRHNRFNRL